MRSSYIKRNRNYHHDSTGALWRPASSLPAFENCFKKHSMSNPFSP